MRHSVKRLFTTGLALSGLSVAASAQFDNQWVEFELNSSMMNLSSTALSNSNTETDFAWGDVDGDGDTDVVVVRKQTFTSTGKRANFLLRNDNGVLNNATNMATASDVPGDQGFNTPTNDRDVVLVDMDNDGDLEIATATTLSDSDPKHIGHPRIYDNLGGTGASWNGYRFEAGRSPQLVHFGNGQPRNPRFCSVAGGDVTGDGFADLYFGDYDSSGAGGSGQPSGFDLNDRLWVNDGSGFFSDDSQLRMTSQMLLSAFGNSVVIADFNQDGVNDIVKNTSLNAPQYVAASYNNPNNVGFFNIFDSFHTNAPYHTSEGDLNNDGRLDLIISDDADDRYRLNTGVDPLGRVIWSEAKTFDFISGSDDGFASNNLITDIDGDGWNDVLIADVDVDIGGCDRRLHIYHNETTVAGSTNTVLIEEREEEASGGGFFGGGGEETGWIGAVGLEVDDIGGTHDIAIFDLDGDGDQDMVISRCVGTFVWLGNDPNPECGIASYAENAAPANVISAVGSGGTQPGTTFQLSLTGIVGNGAVVAMSTGTSQLPFAGGQIVVNIGTLALLANVGASSGTANFNLPLPNLPSIVGATAYFQAAAPDAAQSAGLAFSNGVELVVCP